MGPSSVLVGNAGNTANIFNSPNLVPDGQIACFDAKTGLGISMNAALTASSIFFAMGTSKGPVVTKVINVEKGKFFANKKVYVAGTKSKSVISALTPNAAASEVVLKVINKTMGFEPLPRATVTKAFPAGATAATILDDLANMVVKNKNMKDNVKVNAFTNKVVQVTVATAGNATVVVNGVTYSYAFATDAATTTNNFIASYQNAFNLMHGITLSNVTNKIQMNMTSGSLQTISVTGTGASAATTTATSTLTVECLDFNTEVDVILNGVSTFTKTNTPFVAPVGNFQSIQKLVEDSQVTYGIHTQINPVLVGPGLERGIEDNTDTTGTYTVFTISSENNYEQSINRSDKFSEIFLCYNINGNPVTNLAGVDTFFGSFLV